LSPAQQEVCLNLPTVQNYKEQNREQKKYEKSGPFHTGDYVYLDYKETTFAKSFDVKISVFFLLQKVTGGNLEILFYSKFYLASFIANKFSIERLLRRNYLLLFIAGFQRSMEIVFA
jgi:hypothetical protein